MFCKVIFNANCINPTYSTTLLPNCSKNSTIFVGNYHSLRHFHSNNHQKGFAYYSKSIKSKFSSKLPQIFRLIHFKILSQHNLPKKFPFWKVQGSKDCTINIIPFLKNIKVDKPALGDFKPIFLLFYIGIKTVIRKMKPIKISSCQKLQNTWIIPHQ